MRRSRVLTKQEEFALECSIYNNKTLVLDEFKDDPDLVQDTFMESVLLKRETIIELEQEDYAITTLGRLFNVRYGRHLKAILYPFNITYNLRDERINLSKLIKQYNLQLTYDQVVENHRKNKWGFVLPTVYRKKKKYEKLYKPFR